MSREYQGEVKTGEDDTGEFCAQTEIGRRACRDKKHAYRDGGIFGHKIDKALGVQERLDLLQ